MALSRIQTAEIADNAITTAKVDDATVIATDIIDGTIVDSMVASGAAIAHTKCDLGTVAGLDVGTGANQIVQMDSTPKLPALNGSALTNLTAANLTGALPVLDGTALTGIVTDFTPLENQMTRLALHIGAVEQLAKFNMIDQVIDDYEDATGIDAYNGVDAVGAYQDHSSNAHTVTAVADATTSTSIKKVGTASLQMDGTGDWFTIPDGTWIDIGTGDFTMEAWIYQTDSSTWRAILGSGNWGGPNYDWTWDVNSSNDCVRFNLYNGSSETGVNMSTAITADTWTHVAVVRYNGTITQYLNGVADGSTLSSTHNLVSNGVVYIGNQSRGVPWQGNIDEVRISNNARYTANFTAFGQDGGTIASPTPFTSDANTILLIHGEASAAVPNTGSSSSATLAGSTGAKYYSGSSNSNQTLVSTTTTAQTAPTKASIVLQTEDELGTATINTDVKTGVSRDALNYVDTTLAKIGTWGSGNVYAANDVTMPGTVMTKIVTVPTVSDTDITLDSSNYSTYVETRASDGIVLRNGDYDYSGGAASDEYTVAYGPILDGDFSIFDKLFSSF